MATGARARPLSYPSSGELATLRSYDDALRLCETLDGLAPDSAVVIIGGGFIGGGAATSIKARGLVPIVLEAAERPLITVLGDEVSAWLQLMAEPAGIDLRT